MKHENRKNRALALPLATAVVVCAVVLVLFNPLTKGDSPAPAFTATATKTAFTNQDIQHDIPITISVANMPADLTISRLSCQVGGGLASCSAKVTDCAQAGTTFSCAVTISPVNYSSPSAAAAYDPSSRTVRLSGNAITLHYTSGDGAGRATMSFEDITVSVVPVCGKSGCEKQAGESPATCCIDCGCPAGQYCYTGNRPSGECVSVTGKSFIVESFDPPAAAAVPFFQGGQWHFPASLKARLRFNVGRDFTLSSVWLRVDGKDYRLNCTGPTRSDAASVTTSGAQPTIVCPVALPPMKAPAGSTDVYEREMELFALISFAEEGVEQTQTLKTDAKIPISFPAPLTPVEGCREKLSILDDKTTTISRFVASIRTLCEYWDKADTQYKLKIATDECCKDPSNPEKCLCRQYQRTTPLEKYLGQDHSCYLCAHPCLCDTLPHFDAVVAGYQFYRDHLEAVCSATDFSVMSSALSSMRQDISKVAQAMDAIKAACAPVTRQSDRCQKPEFPECSLESGLAEHGDTNLKIMTEHLP